MPQRRPRPTIEQFAKAEVNEEKEKAEMKEAMKRNAARLAEEMPGHFFRFCDYLRDAVKRFNEHCDPEKRIYWRESAALAMRDPNPNLDFNLTFNRQVSEINVGLNVLGRSGKPQVFLIEINGKVRDEVFMARVEGQARKEIEFRITVNFKKQDIDLKLFAERLVLGVVSQEMWQILDDE